MRNIKLTIEYDGTHYAGWQRQRSYKSQGGPQKLNTIQEAIERILEKVLGHKVSVIGSGRTDTGVHAVTQVANFKTVNPMPLLKLKGALNGLLPGDVAICGITEVPKNFHSRFCARKKLYRYLIVNQETKSIFAPRWAYWVKHPLDLRRMRQEAKVLLGRHDFKSFQASDRRERGSVTTVNKIDIKKANRSTQLPFLKNVNLVMIDVEAEGFLRNMVRNIVGTLLDIGKGKIKKGALKNILLKKDRKAAGRCAPASGLYLLDVTYD